MKNVCQLKCKVATEICIQSNERKIERDRSINGRKKDVDRSSRAKGISECYAKEALCYTGSVCQDEKEFLFSSVLKEETKADCQRNSTKCNNVYITQVAEGKRKQCQAQQKVHCRVKLRNCMLFSGNLRKCRDLRSKCLADCDKNMKRNVCQMTCEAETGSCTEGKVEERRVDRANRLSQCYQQSSNCFGRCP